MNVPVLIRLAPVLSSKPEPLFPDYSEGSAERIWHGVSFDERAKNLVENLLATWGVEGAYVKPETLADPPRIEDAVKNWLSAKLSNQEFQLP
jgi:hypothetical protein